MHTDDSDWLCPQPAPESGPFLPPDTRVFRDDGDGVREAYAALSVAIANAPASPEAVIVDASGRCLAHAHRDSALWTFTALGRERLTTRAA